MHIKSCWIITEGMVGTENQCIGVSQALGIKPKVLKIGLRQPWKTLSPWLHFENKHIFDAPLSPPWPDLLITSGRKAVAASRYIKRMSKEKTFTLHIQNPKISPANFDLVAVPYHDSIRGKNVIVTDAAPNKITPDLLVQEKEKFSGLLDKFPSPRLAVLIGGNSKTHKLSAEKTKWLAEKLSALDISLLVTVSRRTGDQNTAILRKALTGKNVFFYDGEGPNPYLALLSYADTILVTNDSVSMLSDAASTGKPVYYIELDGSSKRFQRLYQHLHSLRIIRKFDGNLEHWSYEPLNDAQKIGDPLKQKLAV